MVIPTLALDLGTKTGWALRKADSSIDSGTFDNSLTQKDRALISIEDPDWDRKEDPRFVMLYDCIEQKVRTFGVKKVVFEDVQFSAYTLQTQLWSTFRAAVWALRLNDLFEDIAIGCLNTATLKLVATGRGNATKQMMAAWAAKKYPEYFQKRVCADVKKELYIEKLDGTPVDDNEVDAFHLLKHFSP